ncbi:MAG: hypothetical protein AAGF92_07880 [Myxococcota bacterium]
MEGLCETYDEWKHCITVKCRIPLTSDFVAKRIKALNDERNPTTARFIALYGDSYRLRTIGWFEQARNELGG